MKYNSFKPAVEAAAAFLQSYEGPGPTSAAAEAAEEVITVADANRYAEIIKKFRKSHPRQHQISHAEDCLAMQAAIWGSALADDPETQVPENPEPEMVQEWVLSFEEQTQES